MFTFGNAGYFGSAASERLAGPIVGVASTHDGKGYWLLGSDGGDFAYGDAGFHGSLGSVPSAGALGLIVDPDGAGYVLVDASGTAYAFGR